MKPILIVLFIGIFTSCFADDHVPSIDRHAPLIDPNPYTFSFVLTENRIFIHNGEQFDEKQFLAIAKTIYRARPSARISMTAKEGITFAIDDPVIKLCKEIGFQDVIALCTSF